MTERRRLNLKDKLEILIRQSTCPICGEKLGDIENLDWDHEQALARGGTDTNDNLRAVHRECHKAKTFGTKYDRRNADNFEAKKTNRLEGKNADFYRIMSEKKPGKPREKKNSIRSRGFKKASK